MDHRLYRTFFASFVESRTTYHHNIPTHNLMCLEKLNEISLNSYLENDLNDIPEEQLNSFPFLKNFNYYTDNCTVLYPGLCLTDKSYDLVFKQILWKSKLTNCIPKNLTKGLATLKKKNLLKNYKLDKKTSIYLKLLKNSPCEEFVGDYNWLYTGGNIAGVKYYNDYCLVTPDELEESTFLNIIRLDSTFKPIWNENIRPKRFYLLDNEPVYQITCNKKWDEIFFSVRQRERISLKKLNDDCSIKEVCSYWSTGKRNSNKKYWTSCDLSKDSKYLSLVKNTFQITVYDVEAGTSVFSLIESENELPWNRVLFSSDVNEIYFADQCSFKLFDLRTDFKPSFTYKPTAVTNRCEKITNFFGSESRENIIYMTTSHNMAELDIRNGKNIQRWTHMMKFPAQFGGISRMEDSELIILQSEDSSELIGIHNEGLLDNFPISKSSPYLFSTMNEELVKAQVNGIGLHPKIAERLDFNITGLHVVGDSNGINVCTVNGGGDVFMTRLKEGEKNGGESRRSYDISSDAMLGIQNIERHCCQSQTEKKEFMPNKMYDVTQLFSDLKNPEGKIFRKGKLRELCHYWPRCEIYSPESLYFRRDFMAEKILPHWDIKLISQEEFAEEEKEKVVQVEEVNAKVMEWIESNMDTMMVD